MVISSKKQKQNRRVVKIQFGMRLVKQTFFSKVMLQYPNKAFQITFFHYTFCDIAILKLFIQYYSTYFSRGRQKLAIRICFVVNNTVFIMS